MFPSNNTSHIQLYCWVTVIEFKCHFFLPANFVLAPFVAHLEGHTYKHFQVQIKEAYVVVE